jgi:succinoglycan biosynthesis transport protein ExoP
MASSRADSGIDLVLNVLRRRKWIGVAAFAAVFSLAAPFAVFLPDIYRGTATVIVDSQQAPSSFVRGAVPELDTRLMTIQQELLSRTRLGVLITRLNLYPRLRAKLPLDGIVDSMRRDIHVDFTGTDQARGNVTTIGLKITYIGLDPKTAAAVPNALATLYIEENTKMRERQTGQLAGFLKGQLDSAARELDRQEARVKEFKRDQSDQLPEQMSINLMTLEQLRSQLRSNADTQLRIRDKLDRTVDPAGAAVAPDELTVARNHLRDLQARYTDAHPEVIAAKAQVTDLEQQHTRDTPVGSDRPSTKADRSAERELARLQGEERALQAEIANYGQRIQMAPKHGQDLEEIESDYKSAKASYDSIRGRYEEAQLADSLEQTKKGESFRILDAAVAPRFPAAPNRMRLLIMAMVFAMAGAIGAMLVAEHVDTSFHTVGELRQFTTIPVLATIPHIKGPRKLMRGMLRAALSVAAVLSVCLFLVVAARHVARGNTQLVWVIAGPKT